MKHRAYQVKDVARIAKLSVRTLHHYDELGLLSPSDRTEAGYRLYGDGDLLRLQQILLFRELGLPLEEIRGLLDDPGFDRRSALVRQRQLLERRAHDTERMLRAVDAALALLDQPPPTGATTMNPETLFDGFDAAKYEAEAEQRWGDTDAFKESARRTKRYTPEDWKRYRAEADAIVTDAAAAMQSGKTPDSTEAMDIAERHRLSIDRWFYPCWPAMHEKLADLYEADTRFAANIDRIAEGLTPFLSAAIRANARHRRAGA